MSTTRNAGPLRRQPLQEIGEGQQQSFHPDLSVLTTVFTGQGAPRPYSDSSRIMPFSADSGDCQYPTCPLRFAHPAGPYRHMDQLPHFTDIRPHFGASNPPPRIWTARENILRNQGTEADFTNVAGFIRAHSVEWTSAEKQHALKLQEIRNQELNQEIEMEDLVEDMDDVEIRKEPYIPSQRPFGIFTDEPPDSIHNSGVLDVTPPPPTSVFGSETDTDREIDEQLKEAFLEMEWEDTQEAAARMDITDDAEKENDAPAQLDAPGYDKGGQPLQELMEDAHRICVEIGEELARNGDYADNSDDML